MSTQTLNGYPFAQAERGAAGMVFWVTILTMEPYSVGVPPFAPVPGV